MTDTRRFQDIRHWDDMIEVRCGVCRDRSIDRRGDRRADFLGMLVHVADGKFRWEPVKLRNRERGVLGRASLDVGSPLGPKGVRTRCRNGHDLRVGLDRIMTLPISADGVLYLPGS